MALSTDDRNETAREKRESISQEPFATSDAAQQAEEWARTAAASTGKESAKALVKQADLLENQLGQPERATALRRRALVNDPYQPDALTSLAAQAVASDDWVLLSLLRARHFEIAEPGAPRVEIALELARLEGERLSNPASARGWILRGLEEAPGDVRLHRALVDLERHQEDPNRLLDRLEEAIRVAPETADVDLLMEAASLQMEQGNTQAALPHLERAARRDPENENVLDALLDLLGQLGRHPELADALERRAALATHDNEIRAQILTELGALHENRLFDRDAALDAYERAHSIDPNTPGLTETLARLHAKGSDSSGGDATDAGGLEAALAAYEREAQVTPDRERLGSLVREIERLQRERGTPEAAIPWVQRWRRAAPEAAAPLRLLAELQEASGHEDDQIATLEALDALLPPEDQIENRRALASRYEAQSRTADAERTFARVLALAPTDLASLEGRVRALRSLDRTEALTDALTQLCDQQEGTARVETLSELAQVHRERGDASRAIHVLQRAEREDATHEPVRDQLDALLEDQQRYEEVVERFAARARALPADASIALDLRRAELLSERLQRFDEAAALYRQVLEREPGSDAACQGLEAALRAADQPEALANFLAEQAERIGSDDERDRLLFERAVLLEERLEAPRDALPIFDRLVRETDVASLRAPASERAEALLERFEEWSDLRSLLQRRLGRDASEDIGLHERLARLCADRLADRSGEVAHWERVVALDANRADVWQILSGRYEQEGRVEDWARALEAELATGVDTERELGLRGRLAEVYLQRLDRAEDAHEQYRQILELEPGHSVAGQYLLDLYEEESRYEEMVRLLEGRLAALGTDLEDPQAIHRRTALQLQIAHVRDSRLDDLEGAISALEVALAEVGHDPVVTEPLAAAYLRAEYTQDLVELCRDAADASEQPLERANWLVRLGDAHLAREERSAAADAYRRALTERPGDRAVEASLRALHRALGRTEPLTELLESELRHLAGTAEVPVRLELIELLRESRPADALVHARRILELAPRHADAYAAARGLASSLGRPAEQLALIEEWVARARTPQERAEAEVQSARLLAGPLERADEGIERYRAALSADPGQTAVRGELCALLEREARWEEWLDCWAIQIRAAAPEERATKVEQAANIAWDRISPAAALPWLERLRLERPQDPDVVSRISLAHRESGDREALIRALEAEAALVNDEGRARRLHLERARLLRETGAAGRALAALGEAGRDAEALRIRESLEAELGLHAERARTLETLAGLGTPDTELHCELAKLYAESLGDQDAATRHWQRALEQVPAGGAQRIEILRALADAEQRVGRVANWARYAEQELAALGDEPVFDDRRREIRRALAIAYDKQLGRADAAMLHLRALLDAGDESLLGTEARDQLERAYLGLLRQGGDDVELERCLVRRLERVGGDAADWLELAELREETLRRTGAALEAYRQVLSIDAHQLDALRGMRRTAERLGRWDDVASALEREINADETEGGDRGRLYHALGDLYWHRLQATTKASRCYAAALEADASDFAALRALERLLEAMEDWRGALDLYESEVEVLGDANPHRRREIWLHTAELARDRCDDPERARTALRRAAEIEPLEAPRLLDLATLHEQVGDVEAFVDSFERWCDHPEARATGADHLRLALALEELGSQERALARIEQSVGADPSLPKAWDAAARLRAGHGDAAGSADALCRAADHLPDGDAAERLLEAAEHLSGEDAPAGLRLVREATRRSPDHALAQAARACLAGELGHDEEAERAAEDALGSPTADSLCTEERAIVARAGAEAAMRQGRASAAAALYTKALEFDPEDLATVGAYGEALSALGDHLGARDMLTRRLEAPEPYPQRARHHQLLGRSLEVAGEPDAALGQYEAALRENANQPDALEGSVRVLEALDRVDEGIAAIERWAGAADQPADKAQRLLRAAEWELRQPGREDSAERRLRSVVQADASLAIAWRSLAQLQLDAGRLAEAVESSDRAASEVSDPADFGALAWIQGRALEEQGARREAAEAYGVAAENDPHCTEAILAQARLLRGFGEWREAAAALAAFAERHPGDDSAALADVYEQLGRLRAGPLEDLAGAVLSYRRAIELAPDRLEARAALAELLSHRPGDWEEALEHHRRVLSVEPTHAGCLRVALRIARGRSDPSLVATGVGIQRALGVASAYEGEEAAQGAAPFVSREPRLRDRRFEILRQLAVEAAPEISTALGAARPAAPSSPGDPAAAFRNRMLEVQGELSAPALLTRSSQEVGEAMRLVVALALEPEHVRGDGQLVNALSGALGKRRRRKLRRLLGENASPQDFAGVDFAEWHIELRALAAAEALRRETTTLRTAIVALAAEEYDTADLEGETHLAPRVEDDAVARAFVRRVVDDWLGRL
ncbi:MAG: tetratricopeptide repeat protein [Myxococcota bacterium]